MDTYEYVSCGIYYTYEYVSCGIQYTKYYTEYGTACLVSTYSMLYTEHVLLLSTA